MKLEFERNVPGNPIPEKSTEEKKSDVTVPEAQKGRLMHLEKEDMCEYCGAPFASARNCKICRNNSEKIEFLRDPGKGRGK